MNWFALSAREVKPVEYCFGIQEQNVSLLAFFWVFKVKSDCHDLEPSSFKDLFIFSFIFTSLHRVESISCFFFVDEVDLARQALHLIDLCGIIGHVFWRDISTTNVLDLNIVFVLQDEESILSILYHLYQEIDVVRALSNLIQVIGRITITDEEWSLVFTVPWVNLVHQKSRLAFD